MYVCVCMYVCLGQALPSGPLLKFVYDCPDFEEICIFSKGADGAKTPTPRKGAGW